VVLSNLYLHYVLDLWFERIVKPRLHGEAYLIRSLDDCVVCLQRRADAERFQQAVVKQLAKFAVVLEPNQTRRVTFVVLPSTRRGGKGNGLRMKHCALSLPYESEPRGSQRMIPAPPHATAEAWLAWFDAAEYRLCHSRLCARYALDAHEADGLINTARLQIFCHWDTLTAPLAYFRTILQRESRKHLRRRHNEKHQLDAYAHQHRRDTTLEACTMTAVTAVLEQVPTRQRRLLQWFLAGYPDAQVATWLRTTPQAVRKARSMTYRTIQHQVERAREYG
jgi:hypothetical protein